MKDSTLYTPEEVAQILKLSKYTIYEMIKRGEIPAHRIGRSLRVSDSQLEAYLNHATNEENVYEGEAVDIAGIKYGKVKGASGDLFFNIISDVEGPVRMSIKPEDVIVATNKVFSSARNVHEGVITAIEELDNGYKISVNIGVQMNAIVSKISLHELDFKLGDTVYCVFKSLSVSVS